MTAQRHVRSSAFDVAAPTKGGDDRWDEAPRERANGAFAWRRALHDRDVRPLAARLDQQSS